MVLSLACIAFGLLWVIGDFVMFLEYRDAARSILDEDAARRARIRANSRLPRIFTNIWLIALAVCTMFEIVP